MAGVAGRTAAPPRARKTVGARVVHAARKLEGHVCETPVRVARRLRDEGPGAGLVVVEHQIVRL